MPVDLRFYNLDETPVTVPGSTEADAGVPGTPVQYILVNGLGVETATTAEGYRLAVLGRLTSDDQFVGEGLPVLDGHWMEVRIASGYNHTLPQGPWVSLGPGSTLAIPALASDRGVYLDARLNAPLNEDAAAFEVTLALIKPAFSTAPAAADETGGGVSLGLADLYSPTLLNFSGVAENVTPDEFVAVSEVHWIAEGRPYAVLASLVELTDEDGDAATLAAGEAYVAALTAKAGGTLELVKGSKATEPLDEGDRPVVPIGSLLLAWITRSEDAVVEAADIVDAYDIGGFAFTSSGLNASVGPGSAVIADRQVESVIPTPLVLSAAASFWVWLRRDGAVALTSTASPPETAGGAILLWSGQTDGSAVTSLTDRRKFVGFETFALSFEFGLLAIDTYSYGALPPGTWHLVPSRCMTVALRDLGTSPTAGATVLDFEVWDGSSWNSIFTSQTASVPDRGPIVAWDDSGMTDDGAAPEVCTVEGPAPVRAKISMIPTATAAPSGCALAVQLRR